MAYDVTLVQVNASIGGFSQVNTAMGFPPLTPFDTVLFSYWTCLPTGAFGTTSNGGPEYIFFFGVNAQGDSTHLTLGAMPGTTQFYDAIFTGAPANVRANHLISVNCHTQTVQYYVNDVEQSVISGGWTASGQFNVSSIGSLWDFDIGSSFGQIFPAFADLWFGKTGSFVDLSIEANRRKFINADLSPVFLGNDGSAPFGAAPQIYQTILPGGVPNDFLINRGSGISFNNGANTTLTFQTPGTCHLPLTASLTGVSAAAQVGSLSFPTSTWAITSNLQTPSPGAVGDVWADDSYIDFSDPTVRAAFENADGSWLDLGYNGATPTGSSPLLYLTVQLQQPPSDILTGYGQDGAQTHWALLDQGTNPSTGLAYPAMSFDACAPVAGNLELTDIEVTATSQIIPDNQVTLRWSDDAGASWSNGLLKSLGEAGEYFTAPSWYRLGMSRNRILELSWSGARAEALQGVFVQVTISAT